MCFPHSADWQKNLKSQVSNFRSQVSSPLLYQAGQNGLQIILLTCHPEDYSGLSASEAALTQPGARRTQTERNEPSTDARPRNSPPAEPPTASPPREIPPFLRSQPSGLSLP